MSKTLRIDTLNKNAPTAFQVEPDREELDEIARALDVSALRKMRFSGEIRPSGTSDWRLDAKLGATVVQPCVITLEPVTTRIDDPVTRHYSATWEAPEEGEFELDEGDDSDPIPETLDLLALAQEALALALPAYPRLPDAELETRNFAAAGVKPLTDEDAKPFASLADLKKKLENGD